jgi:hypothetical protein
MPHFADCTMLIYRYEGRISVDMLCYGVVQSVLISILPRPHSIIKVVPSKAKIVVNFIWRSSLYRAENTFCVGYKN